MPSKEDIKLIARHALSKFPVGEFLLHCLATPLRYGSMPFAKAFLHDPSSIEESLARSAQPVEARRKSARGLGAAQIPLVAGGGALASPSTSLSKSLLGQAAPEKRPRRLSGASFCSIFPGTYALSP